MSDKAKKKFYTRSIRLLGKLIRSPRFLTKKEADSWFDIKKHERDATFKTYQVKLDSETTLHDYFTTRWMPDRKNRYPAATYKADQQRYDDYVKPVLGHLVVSKINALQIRKCLSEVVLVHKKSIQTRNRVRALLSKVFSDAMNEPQGPLRDSNPALNMTFTDAREGSYEPAYIAKEKDIKAYLSAAKELGPNHLILASLGLMSGIRKSEMIPLKWGDVDDEECCLHISRKFEQASYSILEGTKAGRRASRMVPIPDELLGILRKVKKISDFQGDDDFVLNNGEGDFIGPRRIATMTDQISSLSGVKATPHALRHTYGREFAKNSGNMKALQAILGHSNSTVTDLYSKLAGKHLSKVRNTVSFTTDEDEND